MEEALMDNNKMSFKVRQFPMFAGPALVLFVGTIIVPLIYGFYLTFISWDGVALNKPFVGVQNYIDAFHDSSYWASLGRTFIYSFFAVILINLVAFALAYLVTRGIKGQNFFRAGFFVPNLIGGIVLGYVWQTFWKIVFPLLGPTTATVAIIDAMAFWNDYLLPSLVLTQKDLYTIPISTKVFYGTYSTDIGLVMAALLLAMLPILILYLFLQKFIVKGVTSGAVKG
jgi:ABC-type glycerol-3-phosphate transport system permease component